jgi:Zn-dependent protease
MQPDMIFQIIVIIYSIILHEIAHGYAAYLFGDKTAYYNNRLTLNPVPHIDIVGSIIVPAFLIMSQSSIFMGWAKPVPVAEHNLNPYKLGSFCVSFAGVFVNFLLAVVFTVIGSQLGGETLKNLCAIVAITNLGLAVFNLIPVPPADGYRIISLFLPWDIKRKIESFIQQNFIVTIVIAILVATQIFRVIFPFFYKIILGFIF